MSHLTGVAWSVIFVTAVAAGATAVEPAVKDTYLADLVAELNKPWPANRIVTIVAHGHSVPAGYFATPKVDTFNAYPHLLHVRLKERHPTAVINVIVTAKGGEQSEQGAARFDSDVLTHKPDLVLIDYGLNDRALPLDRAERAWTEMIEKAKARGTRVLLLTPTADLAVDIANDRDDLNQRADQIRGLAARHGVGLVDSYAAFKAQAAAGRPLAEFMSQRNHPNRRGHDLVADALGDWFPR